jgi:hypothetical protein
MNAIFYVVDEIKNAATHIFINFFLQRMPQVCIRHKIRFIYKNAT